MKKIYVVCPANLKTGGPELLHQLVNLLKSNGVDITIAYFDVTYGKCPIHEEFRKYVTSWVDLSDVEDNKDNIIIFPETQTLMLYNYNNSKKVIWWLSVDFWQGFNNADKFLFLKRFVNKLCCQNIFKTYRDSISLADLHLYQSEYAKEYLGKMGYKSCIPLSDYINDSFFEHEFSVAKEDIVLFNPKKGYKFTKKIIDAAKGEFSFIPIQNLTTEQVGELLSRSKVYIDFGNHPGKDRFPREAAISGCCVITGKRGAANNQVDVCISEDYKFEDEERCINRVLEKIRYCILFYDKAINDFRNYRYSIMSEKAVFEKQAKAIVEILHKL